MPTLTERLKGYQNHSNIKSRQSEYKKIVSSSKEDVPEKESISTKQETPKIVSKRNSSTLNAQPNSASTPKISLVPTNLLIQRNKVLTHPKQIHLTQPQHRILYAQQNSKSNTGIVTTGPGGMKVLLVNAADKTASHTNSIRTNCINTTVQSSNFIQQQPHISCIQPTTAKQQKTEPNSNSSDNISQSEVIGRFLKFYC